MSGRGLLIGALALAGACADPAPEATPALPAAAPVRPVLSVDDAWARPADSGRTSAVYFTLRNRTHVADTLVGVTTAIAAAASVHMSMQHQRTMQMAAIRELPVPGEDSVPFRPLGAHVMLTALGRRLAVGDTVPVTLRFRSGDSLRLRAVVRAP